MKSTAARFASTYDDFGTRSHNASVVTSSPTEHRSNHAEAAELQH